jgi:hypothetical protein
VAESLELAFTNSTAATYNTHTLQWFALDAYARDIDSAPEGCPGVFPAPSAPADEPPAETPEPAIDTPSATEAPPVPTSSAAQSCHTHGDGEVSSY